MELRTKIKVSFFQEFIPPKTTAQQKGRRSYNPAKVSIAAATWRAVFRKNKPANMPPLEGPIRARLQIFWPFTKEQIKNEDCSVPIPKFTKPDFDNIGKAPWDALEKEGYFSTGDQQIHDGSIVKWHGPIPGVSLEMEEL